MPLSHHSNVEDGPSASQRPNTAMKTTMPAIATMLLTTGAHM